MRRAMWGLVVVVAVAGCAVRLGGPRPVEYRTLGWEVPAGVAAADVAAVLRSGRAEIALLAAPADSAWFAEVARAADRTLSGPAPIAGISLAFLGGTPLGDTTVVLAVESGGELVVHDALYRVDQYRYLNLLALHLPEVADTREAVRSLLRYVATDVMLDAVVVLAVHAGTTAAGDSVASLLRPHLTDALACRAAASRADSAQEAGALRLFFGPEARAHCAGTEFPPEPNAPVLLRVVVER